MLRLAHELLRLTTGPELGRRRRYYVKLSEFVVGAIIVGGMLLYQNEKENQKSGRLREPPRGNCEVRPN